ATHKCNQRVVRLPLQNPFVSTGPRKTRFELSKSLLNSDPTAQLKPSAPRVHEAPLRFLAIVCPKNLPAHDSAPDALPVSIRMTKRRSWSGRKPRLAPGVSQLTPS